MRNFLLILLLAFSISATAQTNELELDPVTISASLQASPVSRTGRNITVIRTEAFNRLPVHSIDELLRYTPGIEIQMRGPAGSQSDIVLRGGTFQQVLVILDGIRLNDPNTGHFNSYIPISPAEIDRIEILKGASSAIYGSEAVGGVIHIITKTFAATQKSNRKNLTAGFTGGEYNLINVQAGGNYQNKSFAIGGGILSNNSDGQSQRGTRGFFHNNTASVSLKKYFGEHLSFAIRSSYDQRKFGAQNFYTSFVSDTARETVSSQWNQAALTYNKGKHVLAINGGLKTVRDEYQFNPKSVANYNRSRLIQLLITDYFRINESAQLSTGIQYVNRKINSNDRGLHFLEQWAGFVVLDKKWKSFSISPSLRLDHSQVRGTELIPQLNLSYHLAGWQFRASAGKTIRDADFTERYNNYNKALVTGGSIGNPDLQAERSFSYEIGFDRIINNIWRFSFTAFERRQQQLIDWVSTPYANMPRKSNLSPTGSYALASNIAKVNTSGLELDIQMNKKFNRTLIQSGLGLLWLNSKSPAATPSFYLSSHARFMANLKSNIQFGPWALAITSIYKNRKPQSANAINAKVDENIFLLNLRGSYRIKKLKSSLFIELDNVTNKANSDLLGSRLPGRWLMGGIIISN